MAFNLKPLAGFYKEAGKHIGKLAKTQEKEAQTFLNNISQPLNTLRKSLEKAQAQRTSFIQGIRKQYPAVSTLAVPGGYTPEIMPTPKKGA